MANRSRLASRLVLAAALLSAAPVHAGGTSDLKTEAKQHFDRARAAEAAGDYDRAIVEFRAAYALFPAPDFLYNIAHSQAAKGDKKAALQSFKEYLAAAPDGRGAADAREQVARLTKELEPPAPSPPTGSPPPLPSPPPSRPTPVPVVAPAPAVPALPRSDKPGKTSPQVAAPPAPSAPPPAVPKTSAPVVAAVTPRPALPVVPPAAVKPANPASAAAASASTPLYKRWWLWTVVGVVAVGAGVGVGVGLSQSAPVTPTCPECMLEPLRPF